MVSADGKPFSNSATWADSAESGSPEAGKESLVGFGRKANSSATATAVSARTSHEDRRERKAEERRRMIVP